MSGTRRRGRELALQALYQADVTSGELPTPAADLWRHFDDPDSAPTSDETRTFATELVTGVRDRQEQIDALVGDAAEHWRIERLSQIDRNILRIGTYELLYRPDVPASVAIDEAIEIAKRFGNDESATFVNGVLDQVAAVVGAKDRERAR